MIEPDKLDKEIDALSKLEADIASKLSSLLAKDKNDDPWAKKYLRDDIQTDVCEYNWLIVEKFMSLIQSDRISHEQIRELQTKANRFNQDLDAIFPKDDYRPSFCFRWSNRDEHQKNTGSPNLHISKGSYGRERRYAPYIIRNNLITSLLFFDDSFGRGPEYISLFNLEYQFASQLFSDENLLLRIYFAVIFDNPSALKIFLDQVIALNPQRTYKNTVDDFHLVGVAAANGCIKILKFFSEIKANFERKYIIDTNAWNYKFTYDECDSRSLLLKYKNCTLEMSALALAISALPAMHEQEAIELLDLLLSTGADPNQDVIVRWQATGEEKVRDEEDASDEEDVRDEDVRMEPALKRIKLADFDHTGVFSELIRIKQTLSAKKTLPVISEIDVAVIAELKASIAMLENKHAVLLEEVNMILVTQADAFKAEIEKRDNRINLLQKEVTDLSRLLKANQLNLPKQTSQAARGPHFFEHAESDQQTVSGSNKCEPNSELSPQETTGFGDCAIHAAFGKWNGNEFHCDDVKAKRKEMANKIRSSKTDATLDLFVKEAIRALVMENKSTGKTAITQAQKEFQTFTDSNQARMQAAWDEFNRVFNQHPSVIKFIDTFCKDYCAKRTISFENLSLKDKFQICLNESRDNTLRDLMFRVTDLEKAFTAYNHECSAKFDWEQIYSHVDVVNEYADFIETPGNWFLPVDLQILCHVFNITMDYYLKDRVTQTSQFITTYNPNKPQRVAVCFNGINHYEQMVGQNQLITRPINVMG